MSLNVGTVQATAELNMRRFSQGMAKMRSQGASSSANVEKSLGGIGSKLTSIAFLAQAALGSALVIGAKRAVKEFALLEGSMAKFEVVFANQAGEMEAWVNTIRERMPLANREIIAAAASMQDLLVPMGIARDQATGMTKQWLELAAALAAFNDVPVDQALEAIRSGIAGQSRPLRQFGIDVRETALQQIALEEGLVKAGQAMDENARQQALLLQAYRQSKDAIDGYEDQLGSTLIMEQNLQATYKDTIALIGKQLQPAYNRLLESTTRNLTALRGILGGYNQLFDDIESGLQRAFRDDASIDDVVRTFKLLSDGIERTEEQLRKSLGAKEYQDRLDDLNKSAIELSAVFAHLSLQNPEKTFEKTSDAVKVLKPLMDNIKPIDEIFDPTFLTATIDEMEKLTDIVREWGRFDQDFSEFLAPTTAGLESIVAEWESFDFGDRVTDELNRASGAAQFFSRTLGDGLQQVIFQAQSVEDALRNIIKQLASRALVTGLMALFSGGLGGVSFGRAMFGGQFHTGGIVGGTGEKIVRVQGGEGVFTPAQMKAMGSQGGGAINLTVHVKGGTQLSGNDLRYVIDEQVRQIVRLT